MTFTAHVNATGLQQVNACLMEMLLDETNLFWVWHSHIRNTDQCTLTYGSSGHVHVHENISLRLFGHVGKKCEKRLLAL